MITSAARGKILLVRDREGEDPEAYSDLIKNFEKVRSYMRDFYVYGFKGRNEFDAKSARIYDDEYRRVKAWLEGYMNSYTDETGKKVFISIDSRAVFHNPLYTAFKTKSFTDWDITLHFFLLDILSDGPATVGDCVQRITEVYLKDFPAEFPDERTVRNKLSEYEKMGILVSRKRGRNLVYSFSEEFRESPAWRDAIAFYTEAMPLGVIGSYFPQSGASPFGFKHRYLLDALDSEIVYDLCECMNESRAAELTLFSRRKKQENTHTVYPVRFYFSVQSGRQYLLGYHYRFRRPMFFRLDCLKKVKALETEKDPERYEAYWQAFDRYLWGVSPGDHTLDHLEMLIHAGPDEGFIAERLMREKRHGTVEQADGETWKFTADVYDATEMLPWIRTFIGRIEQLTCTSDYVVRCLQDDLTAMNRMYGGDTGAV